MDNRVVSGVLEDVANLMELNGENPFRARAYTGAARAIETLETPVDDLVAEDTLSEIKGIGKTLAREVAELIETGSMKRHRDLLKAVPEGLAEMSEIPGLGGKRLRTIYETLGISDIDALAKACASGAVEQLKGFGRKSAESISQGIEYLQTHRGQYLLSTACSEAEELLDFLRGHPEVVRAEVAGSIRRWKETTKDVDLVASTEDPEGVAAAFAAGPQVARVIAKGSTMVSVELKSGMNADLRIVEDAGFANALHHFTGSKEHNTQMRSRAKSRGLKLNEYGLFDGEETVPCAIEEEIFKALDLNYIPPEMREGIGEIERAEDGALPRLLELDDLEGTVHVHTQHSDGRGTIEAMARAANGLGYGYIGICDHSFAAGYAGGLSEERVRAQWEEIDEVQSRLEGIRILKGTEVDIMVDGRLDFDDDFLEEFDLVVASVHSVFGMDGVTATERVIRAVENRNVDILGHITGRLLLSRDGYPLDIPAVLDAAAASHTAIEINAHPRRLELDWRYLALAREKGVKISVNTDAHGAEGLEDMVYGVRIARKGGLGRDDVLNVLDVDSFLSWCSGEDIDAP